MTYNPPIVAIEKEMIRADVDEFIDNRDGTSTLVVTCASGKSVRFTIPTKKLKSLNVDDVYDVLQKECQEP